MAKVYESIEIAKKEMFDKGKFDANALAVGCQNGTVPDEELLANKKAVPTWRAKDFTDVPVNTPYQYDGTIYKLKQPHDATGNPGWTPPATPALWAAVNKPGEDGTKEHPITAARGMEYKYGLYYIDPEDNNLYQCVRQGEAEGGSIVLQFLPHELVGHYFVLVTEEPTV